MSREGSLEAPTRHTIDWRDPDFTDAAKLDAEMRRVFDICHGCRRCFNLCDSFPRLFDLVDESPHEMEGVKSEDFSKVVEACTLCDMCFMTKCPYVPPHPFNLDFPHLMLRYRAAEAKAGRTNFVARQLAERGGVERVYLGVRNMDRGAAAMADLEATTGRKVFELVRIDTSDLGSARDAAASLPGPVDGLLMNAGGRGGSEAQPGGR